MSSPSFRTVAPVVFAALASASLALASDWSNLGGNIGRNGLTEEFGPVAPDLLWSGGPPSSIAWQPVTEGNRVFMVRDSLVVAMDLTTGAVLWTVNVHSDPGDWLTWVGGVKNGKVYACRGGNGASVAAPLYALDAATGAVLWSSADEVDGSVPGFVFTPDGDPIVVSFHQIWRIRAGDGGTAWVANHIGSVSGDDGGAVYGDSLYIADAAPGGHVLKRYDLATGAFLYQSPVMPGFTLQNHPMVGPDGTVYLSRTQGNPATDFFYAFADTGTALVQKWRVPTESSADSEFGVGPDGSVYMLGLGHVLHRLDPVTGAILNTSPPIASVGCSPRIAIDPDGRLYVNNGCALTIDCGRFLSFEADLTPRWSIDVPLAHAGAPALGAGGTLVICGVGANSVKAYRTPHAYCSGKVNSLGCTPSIGYAGSHPSATGGSGFSLTCSQVLNHKPALLFYGVSGAADIPFQGGYLCVAMPIRRTPVASSGGTPPPANDCSGLLSIDFNAYIASGSGAPELQVPGTRVSCEWWGRDPGYAPPNNSQLSGAMTFVIEP